MVTGYGAVAPRGRLRAVGNIAMPPALARSVLTLGPFLFERTGWLIIPTSLGQTQLQVQGKLFRVGRLYVVDRS